MHQWFLTSVLHLNVMHWQIILLTFSSLLIYFVTCGSLLMHLQYFFVTTKCKFFWHETFSPTNVQSILTLITTSYTLLFLLTMSRLICPFAFVLLTHLRRDFHDLFLVSFNPTYVFIQIPRLSCSGC